MQLKVNNCGEWIDSKGRVVLIHTMSNRWLNNIRKSVKDKEKKALIIAELKRRKNLPHNN